MSAARAALAGALALAAIGGAALAAMAPGAALAAAQTLAESARDGGALGLALFALVQVGVAVSGVLPASLLGVAAGAVYGLGVGFALAGLATLFGAWAAFVAARSVLGGFARRLVARRRIAAEFDAAIAREGWRFVALVRLSPVMPFAATSFALGLTRVRVGDYLAGTLASLPALFGYVLIGAMTRHGASVLAQDGGWLRCGGLAVGLAATALLTLRVGRLAQAAYRVSQP